MTVPRNALAGVTAAFAVLSMAHFASAAVYTGAEVLGYAPGAGVLTNLVSPAAALGLPSATTGSGTWDGNMSPFNPHYAAGEIVQVGHGGHLTVRLERFVSVEPGQRHLGVWENAFLVAASGGLVGNLPSVFGADSAELEVSQNGVDFVSVGTVVFDGFGNYWADSLGPSSKTPGTVRADFGRPCAGDVAALAGANYAEVLGFLDGTAGGTWVDLSSSGLEKVGWIRFSGVAEGQTLEIDAVAINTSLAGGPSAKPILVADPVNRGRITLGHSMPHATYRLQYCDDLAAGWQDAAPAVPGTGADLLFTDPLEGLPERRFYRVVLP